MSTWKRLFTEDPKLWPDSVATAREVLRRGVEAKRLGTLATTWEGDWPRVITPEELLSAVAIDRAARGWLVFPVDMSKGPLAPDGAIENNDLAIDGASKDPAQVMDWFEDQFPQADVAVVTGLRSGFFTLQVTDLVGAALLAALEERHGPLPHTLTTRIPRREKKELYFATPKFAVVGYHGFDCGDPLQVCGEGSYTFGSYPPEAGTAGEPFYWEDPDAPLAEAPDWLLEKLRKLNEERLANPFHYHSQFDPPRTKEEEATP